jgi:predicted ABC-type transport system involved in lysophospholipase L1 biosynthesis ATPase subunit
MAPVADLLSIGDICVSYKHRGRRMPLLRNVSLGVNAGEIVAVVGSGGEGRATLLGLATGLVHLDSGQVKLEDVDLMSLSSAKLADLLSDQILWIERNPQDRHLDVSEQIATPLLACGRGVREARAMAWEALDRMGAAGCGWRRWNMLSAWDRLLVRLTRCVMTGPTTGPQLVLIDDPFNGLGLRQTHEAGQLLRSLINELGCGILLGIPDLESAMVADRAWRLEEGRLIRVADRLSHLNVVALAKELHERGYKDAAAVITRTTLEEHLRKLAVKCGVLVAGDSRSQLRAEALNHALARVGAYNKLQQRGVTVWLNLCNNAVHGRYAEYDDAQVAVVIRDVSDFMSRFPA